MGQPQFLRARRIKAWSKPGMEPALIQYMQWAVTASGILVSSRILSLFLYHLHSTDMPSGSKLQQRIPKLLCSSSPSDEPPEHELTGEKTESARLEERFEVRPDELAETKWKLEEELRQVQGLLDARDKDLANRDAIQQRLKTINELQITVRRVESRKDFQ